MNELLILSESIFLEANIQDLDPVNMFDEIVYKGPDTPNDDNNLNAHAPNEGGNSSQSRSSTNDLFEDDVGHPQGSNGSANENGMAATSEHDSALSEGDDANIPDTKHFKMLLINL
ncbi:hypothetical protein Tco_0414555 [Tanacetum coccineum]